MAKESARKEGANLGVFCVAIVPASAPTALKVYQSMPLLQRYFPQPSGFDAVSSQRFDHTGRVSKVSPSRGWVMNYRALTAISIP